MKALRPLLGVTAILAGCSGAGPVSVPVSALRVDGKIETTQSGYRGAVTVANPMLHDVSFGVVELSCAVHLEIYASGDLVWDQGRDVLAQQPGGCKWLPSEVTLRPAQSIAVRSGEVSRDSLMARLTPGAYRAFVEVIFARMVPLEGRPGTLTTKIDSVVTVPAGTLTLR